MKPAVKIGIAFVLGALLSYQARSMFGRSPMIGKSIDFHLCNCIDERPDMAPRFIDASIQINEAIADASLEFSARHKLHRTDFHAVFELLGNGSFGTTIWCSNRNDRVSSLMENYEQAVRECLGPHTELLMEAHGVSTAPKH